MSDWYYVQDGKQQGPVDVAELKNFIAEGKLPPDTRIWKEGMVDWVAASTLPGFAQAVQTTLSGTVVLPPPVSDGGVDPTDAEKNKVMGILAYLGILFLVPLLAARDSKFAMYHTNQGLILFIAAVGLMIVSGVLGSIPFIGLFSLLISPLVSLVILALAIIGIINAAKGECKPLPVIGNFTLIK